MRMAPYFAAVSLFAAAGCSIPLTAQGPWQAAPRSPAFERGYDRGVRAGVDDWRRGEQYRFTDEREYRRADDGYRRQYGNPAAYQEEFRRGYEVGYRVGYEQNSGWRNQNARPPFVNGRGRAGAPPGWARQDPAAQLGYADGYEAGLDDGRDRRPSNYVIERRYRSGDRGYEGGFGSRDAYKNRYREAFRQGYQAGYADGRRYRD